MKNFPINISFKWQIAILACVLIAIVCTNIMMAPYGFDIMLSYGAAFQADHLGNFPLNVYKTWNMRGIGYKYLMYGLYKLSGTSPTPDHSHEFEIITKTIYYALLLSMSYFFFYLLKPFLARKNINWKLSFFLFAISAASIGLGVILQPEDISIYLTLGMVSFALSEKKIYNNLAGLFVPLLLCLKVVTVLYTGYALVLLLFLYPQEQKRFWRFCISIAVFTFITIIFYLTVIPREVTDTMGSVLLQSGGYSTSFALKWILNLIAARGILACFLPGIICYVYIIAVNRKKNINLLLLAVLLSISFVYVNIQKEYFAYHYLSIAPLLIGSIFIVTYYLSRKYRVANVMMLFCCVIALRWLFSEVIPMHDLLSSPLASAVSYSKSHDKERRYFKDMDARYSLSSQKEVLTLTEGIFNYYIHSKSYLRHSFVPFALKSRSKSLNKAVFPIMFDSMLSYKGQYIVVGKQIKTSDIPGLDQMLAKDYQMIPAATPSEIDGTEEFLFVLYKRKS